jgi:hypothetical protein
MHSHELRPNGKETNVTGENREEFVREYVKWKLEDSITQEFESLR